MHHGLARARSKTSLLQPFLRRITVTLATNNTNTRGCKERVLQAHHHFCHHLSSFLVARGGCSLTAWHIFHLIVLATINTINNGLHNTYKIFLRGISSLKSQSKNEW